MPFLRAFSMPRLALALPVSLCLAAVLSGCGSGVVATSSIGTLGIQGKVRGGQQPVTSASIFLYSAGKTGNGSAATSMLNSPVITDANGSFTIASDYTCASSTDQVYLVATGGDPGLGNSTNNTAIVLMTALGNCGNLSTIPFVTINEVTTAAAAWTLAQFTTSYANVGASATNAQGISNAFLDAQLLANLGTGAPVLPSTTSNLTTESTKLNTLADAIATCVNSSGGASCTPLFTAATPSGATAPTDTLGALLNIVKNPGQNVAAVYKIVQSTAPFEPTLSAAPNDWTMSMTIQGGALNPSSGLINMSDPNYGLAGGLYYPQHLDIDANGYVWVGNNGSGTNSGDSSVSEFSPQGVAISPPKGYGNGGLNELFALAIDTTGNIWVTNEQNEGQGNGSITGFYGSSSSTPGTAIVNNNPATGGFDSAYFFDNSTAGTYFPAYLSANNTGQIFIGNQDATYPSVFTTSTQAISSLAIGSVSFPESIAADASGGVWLGNSSNVTTHDTTVTHIATNGTYSQIACCSGPYALATDASGNLWIENYDNDTISEVSSSGTVLVDQLALSGVQGSNGMSIDAGQNLWIANYNSYNAATPTIGASFAGVSTTTLTSLSPASGLGTAAGMVVPVATIPDRSGNLWISSKDTNALVVFFGLAVPTATPLMPTPTAP